MEFESVYIDSESSAEIQHCMTLGLRKRFLQLLYAADEHILLFLSHELPLKHI